MQLNTKKGTPLNFLTTPSTPSKRIWKTQGPHPPWISTLCISMKQVLAELDIKQVRLICRVGQRLNVSLFLRMSLRNVLIRKKNYTKQDSILIK